MNKFIFCLLIAFSGVCSKVVANTVIIRNLTNATYTINFYDMGINLLQTWISAPSAYDVTYIGTGSAICCKVRINSAVPTDTLSTETVIVGLGSPYTNFPATATSINTYPELNGRFTAYWVQSTPTSVQTLIIF